MISTVYTEKTPLFLDGSIRGLLDEDEGYCGRVLVHEQNHQTWMSAISLGKNATDGDCIPYPFVPRPWSEIRIDLARPEARLRAVEWMEKDEFCPTCEATGVLLPESIASGQGLKFSDLRDRPGCPACKGTGRVRPSGDGWWMIHNPHGLPSWMTKACLHASVLRMANNNESVRWILHRIDPVNPSDYLVIAYAPGRFERALLDVRPDWEPPTTENEEWKLTREGELTFHGPSLPGDAAILIGDELHIEVPGP